MNGVSFHSVRYVEVVTSDTDNNFMSAIIPVSSYWYIRKYHFIFKKLKKAVLKKYYYLNKNKSEVT